ncbi:hypothetical protein DFJ73DRAFT_766348 [Zopfochytrium polystomum]|nr:hypothetical protein DFJ73DRAFT_766348 [Zopfochytrium polystomum]
MSSSSPTPPSNPTAASTDASTGHGFLRSKVSTVTRPDPPKVAPRAPIDISAAAGAKMAAAQASRPGPSVVAGGPFSTTPTKKNPSGIPVSILAAMRTTEPEELKSDEPHPLSTLMAETKISPSRSDDRPLSWHQQCPTLIIFSSGTLLNLTNSDSEDNSAVESSHLTLKKEPPSDNRKGKGPAPPAPPAGSGSGAPADAGKPNDGRRPPDGGDPYRDDPFGDPSGIPPFGFFQLALILQRARLPPRSDNSVEQLPWTMDILLAPGGITSPTNRFTSAPPLPSASASTVLPSQSVPARGAPSSNSVGPPRGLTPPTGLFAPLQSAPPTGTSFAQTSWTPAPVAPVRLANRSSRDSRRPSRRETSAIPDDELPTTGRNPRFATDEVKAFRHANAIPPLKASHPQNNIPEILSFRMALIKAYTNLVAETVGDRGPVYLDDGSFFLENFSSKNFETQEGLNFFNSLPSGQQLTWPVFLAKFDSFFFGANTEDKILQTWLNFKWSENVVSSPTTALTHLQLLNKHLKTPFEDRALKIQLVSSCTNELLRAQISGDHIPTAAGPARMMLPTVLHSGKRLSLFAFNLDVTVTVTATTAMIISDSRGSSPRRTYVGETFDSFIQQPVTPSRRDNKRQGFPP